MEQRTCTLDHIKALYAASMQAALIDPTKMLSSFGKFIDDAYRIYENMTPEAAAFLAEREKVIIDLLTEIYKKAPDGIEKRRMVRLLSDTKRGRLDAKRLVNGYATLREADDLVKEGHETFVSALQRLLDFMHDISNEIHKGPANFVRINLLYWAVDELTTANFLARKGLTSQAYPHLRCVMEIADKIELFDTRVDMVELWVSGSEQEIWRKLRPAKVRELLGRDKNDPIYSLFSEHGAHPTYIAAQQRMTRKEESDGLLSVGIGVGGIQRASDQAALMGYCIMFANVCTMRASISFKQDLNETEVFQVAQLAAYEQMRYLESLSNAFPPTQESMARPLSILTGTWRTMNQPPPNDQGFSTQ